jgi:hypothetical protein
LENVGDEACAAEGGGFERTVIYRGIKIEPTMAVGKRSPLARAIRDDLRRGMRGMPLQR